LRSLNGIAPYLSRLRIEGSAHITNIPSREKSSWSGPGRWTGYQGRQPCLQTVGQVCTFLRWQRGFKIPSSAAFGKIGDGYVKAIHQYAGEHKIPIVYFKKGQNKEKIAQPYIEAAAREGKDRVVLIGIARQIPKCTIGRRMNLTVL